MLITTLASMLGCFIIVTSVLYSMAASKFAQGHPDQVKPYLLRLYPLWFRQLQEPIGSVREDAAVALASVIRAFGQEVCRLACL